ncbi:SPOR domain-containing protein [Glaciecola sp. KUL10]|uniref:SPOR domain-containing protein n=1 Tax=Glaciecola sp. (strain KUL10) TaxID=2161813 RepID=UPI000D782AB1|nr:SPOR domain-containing protein [Glaciecola sp. KUL10]GBL05476.1 DedD protein [Glaciecola sp. KUL10]
MSSALQNRLVGTIIIVALVVIFLPDLLDGEKQSNNATFVDVPVNNLEIEVEAPDEFPAEAVINATRRPVEIIDESDVTDSELSQSSLSNEIDSTIPDSQAEEQTVVKETLESAVDIAQATQATGTTDDSLAKQTVTTPQSIRDDAGWVVQLGSFRHQKNVNELLDKLDAAGYRAFSRRVDTSAGRLTKVFVGPELTRETLDNALPHLNEATGLKGKVTSFAEATN